MIRSSEEKAKRSRKSRETGVIGVTLSEEQQAPRSYRVVCTGILLSDTDRDNPESTAKKALDVDQALSPLRIGSSCARSSDHVIRQSFELTS